ncbi:uncharacterized protein SCHCODRAFT_02329769 [Schizophyllum commune H4-8]|uniref:uncharacterized protein n=1 Tax=Schizophyllum commune (strain H4-8 / FGSC 9210) TaxID=578458 RepID=UPI00216034A1|nr:uncharacterized protein SCHCODRAFT_02179456 [Schizophyllum commune H4-8]XP_050199813.1 uncharacterized protein SCHCODRAFT_02329769 [Schizophyllum commune H4-8]KAI5836582.1 hypothetical protein SCHCODRAFT_02179456 [Schizophyllum commune H4-8]KAI5891815.1 hypothetical protein SCHCODRAFT_02329769 [Schizophyllum commune H4-8]
MRGGCGAGFIPAATPRVRGAGSQRDAFAGMPKRVGSCHARRTRPRITALESARMRPAGSLTEDTKVLPRFLLLKGL